MLQKSYLKAVAAYIVFESTLSKISKIQLLRFIENEASNNQLKVFINTGEIKKESEIENVSEAVFVPAMIIAAAFLTGKKAYEYYKDEGRKACSNKSGTDKKICMAKFKIKATTAKINALKKEMVKCNKTNNVKKCKNTFQKYINKFEKKIRG